MTAAERLFDRGTRRGDRWLQLIADEVRTKRIGVGISQRRVAGAAHVSMSTLSRIERAKIGHLSIIDASRVAAVLGLDLVVGLYPGASPMRDAAHAERLMRLLKHVKPPLSYALETPLPAVPDRPELRAWDAVIRGHGKRTAVELEMRVRDSQALQRRMGLKRRDDPVDAFLLVLADTRSNRRVLAEHIDLFPDLPRIRTSRVLAALQAGVHPMSGVVLI